MQMHREHADDVADAIRHHQVDHPFSLIERDEPGRDGATCLREAGVRDDRGGRGFGGHTTLEQGWQIPRFHGWVSACVGRRNVVIRNELCCPQRKSWCKKAERSPRATRQP